MIIILRKPKPVLSMGRVLSSEELMKYSNMISENSLFKFSIPGKGEFTLVLQEEDEQPIQDEAEKNLELKRMLNMEQYENGQGLTTTELLRSLSKKDFM